MSSPDPKRSSSTLLVPSRPLYTHAELERLLHPKSVAIVGISPRPGTFGVRTLANMSSFDGRIHLVNGKYDRIEGRPCHPSLSALPEVPDCVAVVVNQSAVEEILRECVELGVGGAVVYASNYAETGNPEKVELQNRLLRLVAGTKTRLLGPNCMGFANYLCKARLTFGRMHEPRPLSGVSVGIVAQSGALAMALSQGVEHGLSVSHTFFAGNAGDVGLGDMVGYLADDPGCQVIVCVFEGLPDVQRLLAGAELAWQRGKPFIVYKMATGTEGAAAALSHTGSLAGSNAAYRAALARVGAVLVNDYEDLMETAVFLGKAGRPTGQGPIVIVTSGGAGVMAADKAEENGVPLVQPAGTAMEVLRKHVPEFGAARNPCDLTAQVMTDDTGLRASIDALLGDPVYSCAVMAQPYADQMASARNEVWKEYAEKHGKIVCNLWLTEWLEGPGSLDVEAYPKFALFRSADRCFAAIAAWHACEALRRAGPRQLERRSDPAARAAAIALLDAAAHTTLTERESKQVLALYGVPAVAEEVVKSAAEAARVAAALARPVVLKLESPDVPHKTEAGVIRLDVRSPGDAARAYDEIMAAAGRITPAPRINGVLVQPMVAAGAEVMIGARIDPLFGPLIVAGLGGIFVELLEDTAVELAPVTPREARAMLDRLRGVKVLRGFRGSAPVDLDRLADIIVRCGELASDLADRIAEIDINPLVCAGSDIVAVDALIVRRA